MIGNPVKQSSIFPTEIGHYFKTNQNFLFGSKTTNGSAEGGGVYCSLPFSFG